jgi:putative ABC transport system ATP-binding protein
MENTIISAKGLVKAFSLSPGNENTVINGICIDISKGEFVAIMGQSGSGKSTLLYCLSGMDSINKGEVLFKGQNISKMADEEISRIRLLNMGFIFQNSFLLKNLTIMENIMLPGIKAGKYSSYKVKKRALELMETVGISNVRDHDIKKVSGGQLQRAAICRALINEPDIIFGDEPTGALNSGASLEVMNILNGIHNKGTTILLVTHDIKVALRAQRVIFLNDGKISSECNLGRWTDDPYSQKKREIQLENWLHQNDF